MLESYEEKAWEFSLNFRRVTPFIFMRKFGLNFVGGSKLCEKIWLRRHIEARKLMKEFNNQFNGEI